MPQGLPLSLLHPAPSYHQRPLAIAFPWSWFDSRLSLHTGWPAAKYSLMRDPTSAQRRPICVEVGRPKRCTHDRPLGVLVAAQEGLRPHPLRRRLSTANSPGMAAAQNAHASAASLVSADAGVTEVEDVRYE